MDVAQGLGYLWPRLGNWRWSCPAEDGSDTAASPAVPDRNGDRLLSPHIYTSRPCAELRASRRQGLPDCRDAGILVRRAFRAGPGILAAKLIAGDGAEGERREPRPGRPDAAGALGRAPGWPGRRPSDWRPLGNPGPGKDTSPGSSSRPRLRQMASPRSVAVESARCGPGRWGHRKMRLPGASASLSQHHAR